MAMGFAVGFAVGLAVGLVVWLAAAEVGSRVVRRAEVASRLDGMLVSGDNVD